MRMTFFALMAFTLSGCGGSPMATYSRTGDQEQFTARQLQTIRLNNCVSGSERCEHGGREE